MSATRGDTGSGGRYGAWREGKEGVMGYIVSLQRSCTEGSPSTSERAWIWRQGT